MSNIEPACALSSLSPDMIYCQCRFTLADVAALWAAGHRADPTLPNQVLQVLMEAAHTIEDTMCESGRAAIQELLTSHFANDA